MILVWVDYLPRYKQICASQRIYHRRLDDLSAYGIRAQTSQHICYMRQDDLSAYAICAQRYQDLSAYGICAQMLLAHMAYAPRSSKRIWHMRQDLHQQTHKTSSHGLVRPRNVRKRNVLSTKRPSTKRPAMKRPDQFDHLHNKCDKKLSILLPYLSAYGICAKIILAHIAYALR